MSAETPVNTEQFLQGMPVELDADAIESQLAHMWKATEGSDPGSPIATRVCLGNVLWYGTAEGYVRTQKILPGVLSRYPARTILVERVLQPDGDPIRAFVNAQCYLTGKGNPLVCAEVIHLRIAQTHLQHLPGLVAPLLVSDVQSTLWYFDADPFWQCGVAALAPLVDRLLVELSHEPDMPSALEHLVTGKRPGCTLSWFRHRHLREEIAAAFDDHDTRKMLPNITEVTLLTPAERTISRADMLGAALTCGWLAARLGWTIEESAEVPGECIARSANHRIQIRIRPEGPAEHSVLCGARVRDVTGAEITVCVSPREGRVLRQVHGAPSSPMPSSAVWRTWEDAETVGFALAEGPGYDLFEQSARPAAKILRAFLGGIANP